jgi:hypothetical protein
MGGGSVCQKVFFYSIKDEQRGHMHFFTLVLIPADTPDIKTSVETLLETFNYEKRVEAYKAYMAGERLQRMAKFYKLPETDLPALATHLKSYCGAEESGIDEGGLFYISTINPQGTWDWWAIGGRWNGVIQGATCPINLGPEDDKLRHNICRVSELPQGIGASYVVTPDGQLYKEKWWPENDENRQQWQKTFRELLERYRDCLAVGVDCHS